MVLGFKPQFVQPILNGTKKHTIREDKHNRWKVGNSIQMATGVRTKKYYEFSNGFCKGIQKFQIKWDMPFGEEFEGRLFKVFIDDRCMNNNFFHNNELMLEVLARNDGFDSVSDFLHWFSEDFEGKIIHWTDLKY
jgi:hypothetical protein